MMADPGILFGILGALLVAAVSPGPSFVMISKIAVTHSRLNGLAAAIGMGLASFLFAALSLGGLVALLHKTGWLFALLKGMGGLYLLYMAITIWRGAAKPLPLPEFASARQRPLLRSFSVGFITQISNPKTIVVYTSIFAAFLPDAPPGWMLFVLPPLFFLIDTAWYSAVAYCFSARHPRALYLAAKKWIDYLTGAVLGALGALGVRLAWESLSDL
jgi:threonine/homoserine/homoserine lactone efflux protein